MVWLHRIRHKATFGSSHPRPEGPPLFTRTFIFRGDASRFLPGVPSSPDDVTGAVLSCLRESQAETSDRRALGEHAVGFRGKGEPNGPHADLTPNRLRRADLNVAQLHSFPPPRNRIVHAGTTE